MLAMFSISKSSVSITKMDKNKYICLTSKNLITFEPCQLKSGDCLRINDLICYVHINKTSPNKVTNNVDSKFTCQISITSSPMKYASPVENQKIENVEHALNDLLNGETNYADSIYNVATQIDIHNAETQVETSPILKCKSTRRSVSKTRKFGENLSHNEINDSEIINFDSFIENTGDSQESQNLLLDYNTAFTNNSVDSKWENRTSESTVKSKTRSDRKKKELEVALEDDSSTDVDEFEIHTELSKSVLSQNQNNLVKSFHNTDNSNSNNIVDPYVALTQIDTNYSRTSKPAYNGLHDQNKKIMDNVLKLDKLKEQMALENDDLYDAPTQIIIPEKNICSDINDLYAAQTQILTQIIPDKTVHSDINDLYDAPTQILTQEMANKPVADKRDTYRKKVLKNCLTQDFFNIECGDATEKNCIEIFQYIDKEKKIVQKNKHDNENPFYACTQDIYNDLKPSQMSESVAKISPAKTVEFAIPKMLSPKKKSTQKIVLSKKTDTNKNYYGCTQDIENDLCSQHSLNSINKPGGSTNKDSTKNNTSNDFISSSQDSISDSYLFPEENEEEYLTPKKNNKSFSVLDIQLPDTPELKRFCKNTLVPNSPSASESENEITDSPPVAYRSKIPVKPKIKRKEPIKESNSINKYENKKNKNCKTENRKKENKISSTKDFESRSNKTISSVSNNISDRRKRRCEELIQDVQDKRPKISNNLRSSPRIQNDKSSPSQKIMITGALGVKHEEIVKNLGGEIVQKDGDVLVTEKFSRTFKSMMSISRGIPIVNTRWLIDSERCSRFLETKKYLINDRDYEKKYSFKFQNLWNTKREKFLKGWTIFITPSIQPPPTEMDEIIKCNGGVCSYQALPSNVKNNNLKNSFTISCVQDQRIYKNLPEPHLTVEAISVGVFTRTLDFQKYRLNA